MADKDLEHHIISYIKDTLALNDLPSRAEAIRKVTGETTVLPSTVAKEIARLIENGTLKYGPGDQLNLIKR